MIISTTSINETYQSCRLGRHESRKDTVVVPPFLTDAHAFSLSRLKKQVGFLVCALKMLPKTLRRSNGCSGQPWIEARHVPAMGNDIGLDVTDRLLAMAAALEMVSVIRPENAPSDMPYIVIEDERIIRMSKMSGHRKGALWEK